MAQLAAGETVFGRFAALGVQCEALKASMLEMTRLEERLTTIIETCSALVRRLQPDEGAQS